MPADLALIGAGYWGRNLARNFLNLGALNTICDSNADVLNTYGAEFDCVRKVSDPSKALSDPEITKVAIAAPAALHYALSKAAFVAGKDVFVEKPLCLQVNEAEDLVLRAASGKRILMVGHLLQYHPHVQRLQEIVIKGDLGKILYISSNRLNLGKIRREENALWSFAPHDISVILSLMGNRLPEHVRCSGEAYLSPGVADTTMTLLRFSEGVRAHVYVSWLNPFKEQKLAVVGSSGMAVFDDMLPWQEKLIVYSKHLTWLDGRQPVPSKVAPERIPVSEAEPLRN